MGKPRHIGKDKLLALDVDIIDVISVDDEAPANTDEQVAVCAKLIANHSLDLPQLEGEQACFVVDLHEVAIVAVRRNVDNLVGSNAHQVGSGGYDQILLQHDVAKVRTQRRCKDMKNGEMYEIGRLMYEMANRTKST